MAGQKPTVYISMSLKIYLDEQYYLDNIGR